MNTPTILYLTAALCGFGLVTSGVYNLAGTGWALITGAVCCFVAAAFIRRGLSSE